MNLKNLICGKNIFLPHSLKVQNSNFYNDNLKSVEESWIIGQLETKSFLYLDTETTVIPTWEALEPSNKEWLLAHNPAEYNEAKKVLSGPKELTTGELTIACFYDGQDFYLLQGPKLNLKLQSWLVAYNAKFDCKVLIKAEADIKEAKWLDLMIADQLIYNSKFVESHKSHKLIDACGRVGFERLSDKEANQTSFNGGEITAEQLIYLLEDVACLEPIYNNHSKEIKAAELEKVFTLENKLIPILAHTEHIGVKFNSQGCWANIIRWEKELVAQEQAMTKTYLDLGLANGLKSLMANKTKKYSDLINFGSPSQIKEIFKWANLTYGTSIPTMEKKDDKKNKITAESTGEAALQEWLIKNATAPDKLKTFVEQLLDYRAKSKLISQYGYGLLYTVMSGHRIHTNYGQCFTNTGRLNSFEPNLQNIPRDNTIRNLFVPDDGYIFFDWDFDGQEIKIAANYSEDELLLAAALEGADIHSTMASISFSLIFGQPVTVVNDKSKYVEVVSPLTSKTHKYNMATELRQHHKNCLFAIFYGGGAKRMYAVLSEYINAFVPPDKIDAVSKEIASKLKAMMPQLLVWLQKSIQEYEENGYVVTSRLGRRVKFGQNAYGDILNSKIQGTGAESIKLAMKKQWEYLREKEVKLGLPYLYLGHIALNVHDQCVLNIKEEYVEQFKPDLDKLASDCLLAFLPLIQPLKIVAKGNIITKWEK